MGSGPLPLGGVREGLDTGRLPNPLPKEEGENALVCIKSFMAETFGVVGSGTMGAGIAQVAARAGFAVVMHDVAEEFLARGMKAIDKSLQRDVDKQRLSPDEKGTIIERIKTTTDTTSLRDAFIVVEAATENLSVKTEIFRALD